MPRGGPRNGRPGTPYPNRIDLGVAKLPAVAAPGQVYGVGKQQVAAQQAVPMGAQPTPQAPPQQPAGPPPVQPGQFGPLDRPTERPNEPVTAGAPIGAGPNMVQGLPQTQSPVQQQQTGAALLSSLATQVPALAQLAAAANRRL